MRKMKSYSLNCPNQKKRQPLEDTKLNFFDTVPSHEAWETHRHLKNRLGIARAKGGDTIILTDK